MTFKLWGSRQPAGLCVLAPTGQIESQTQTDLASCAALTALVPKAWQKPELNPKDRLRNEAETRLSHVSKQVASVKQK